MRLKGGHETSDPRLGRVPQWDERSREWPIRSLVPTDIRGGSWYCHPRYDQGSEGSCVGFGWTHELAAFPTVVKTSEDLARQLYREAQTMDEWPGECVDMQTRALSENGWVGPDELSEGDRILVFDLESENTRWAEVERVHVYPAAPYRIWSHKGFAAAVTDDHHWAVRSRIYQGTYGMRATRDWKSQDQFPRAAVSANVATKVYKDEFVELVAWAMCEGSYRPDHRRGNGVVIAQKVHAGRVAALIGRPGSMKSDGNCSWEVSGELATEIRKAAPGRAPTIDWLCCLTLRQLRLFLHVCELADGHVTPTKGNRRPLRTFSQKSGPILDAWLAACALAGEPVSRARADGGTYGDVETWTRRRSNFVDTRKLRRSSAMYGPVWCPETDAGTFVALRQGSCFITGNSYEGTSVLAGAKAVKAWGFMDSYAWCFGIDDVLRAISHSGPVVLGTDWTESMFDPRPSGLMDVEGSVAGGHCYLARGILLKPRLTGEPGLGPIVRCRNSWGYGWGRQGDFFLRVEDLERLLNQQGEACVPIGRKRALR